MGKVRLNFGRDVREGLSEADSGRSNAKQIGRCRRYSDEIEKLKDSCGNLVQESQGCSICYPSFQNRKA